MIKTIALYRLLERAQAGLNRILLATWAARGAVYAGLPAGIAIVCGRLLGWAWPGRMLWAVLCALGSLAGMALGWRKRYDAGAAAGWLDHHLGLAEALSAAVVCLKRDCAGGLDEAAVRHAENLSTAQAGIRWPVQQLLRWWGGAAATVLVFTVAIGLIQPIPRPAAAGREPSARADEGPTQRRRTAAQDTAAREIASMLFPQNQWLAHRLEQALRAGDLAEVERLVAEAEREMNAAMAAAERSPQAAAAQQRRRQAADKALAEAREGRDGGAGEAGEAEGRLEGRESSGDPDADGPKEPSGDGTGRNREQGGGSPMDFPYYAGLNQQDPEMDYHWSSQGGSTSGTGREAGAGKAAEAGGSEPVTPKSGREQAPISQAGDQYFEYVLPGSDLRIPLAQAAADSARAAEGAIDREQLPLEYAGFVREYFLQLSQEAAGEPPEEDEP